MVWAAFAILFIAIFVLIPAWRIPVGLVFLAFVAVFAWVFFTQRAEERRSEEAALAELVNWTAPEGEAVTVAVEQVTAPRFFSAFSSVEFAGLARNTGAGSVTGVRLVFTVSECPAAAADAAACAVLGTKEETFALDLAPGAAIPLTRTVRFDDLPRVGAEARVAVSLVAVRNAP